MSIKILTNSNCDLTPEIISRYGITVVPMCINLVPRAILEVAPVIDDVGPNAVGFVTAQASGTRD